MTLELQELDALPVIALHPAIADDYRRQVAELSDALKNSPKNREETIPKIRGLIDRVEIIPGANSRSVEIEVSGKLAGIIALATGKRVPGGTYACG